MIRGSMVARKIDLEEKRVFVPTTMSQEPYFSLPVIATPIEKETAVPTPVVSSPDVATNGNEDPVPQDQIEPLPWMNGSNSSLLCKKYQLQWPRKKLENQLFLMTMKSIIA